MRNIILNIKKQINLIIKHLITIKTLPFRLNLFFSCFISKIFFWDNDNCFIKINIIEQIIIQ